MCLCDFLDCSKIRTFTIRSEQIRTDTVACSEQRDYFLTRIISICNVNKRSFAYLDDRFDMRYGISEHFELTCVRCKWNRFIYQGNHLCEMKRKKCESCWQWKCCKKSMFVHVFELTNEISPNWIGVKLFFGLVAQRLTWNKQRRTAYISHLSATFMQT